LDQIFDDYENIRKELEYFSDVLAEKEEVIVLSKADLLDEEMIDFVKSEFVKRYGDKKIFVISSASGSGLDELKDYLAEHIELKETVVLSGEDEDVNVEIEEIKLYDLTDAISARKSDVVYK
jgi:GTP-binding protein